MIFVCFSDISGIAPTNGRCKYSNFSRESALTFVQKRVIFWHFECESINCQVVIRLTTNCREITELQNWLTNSELPGRHIGGKAEALRPDTARGGRAARGPAGTPKIRFMNRTFGHFGRKPGFFINFVLGNTFTFVL